MKKWWLIAAAFFAGLFKISSLKNKILRKDNEAVTKERDQREDWIERQQASKKLTKEQHEKHINAKWHRKKEMDGGKFPTLK